MPDQPVRRIIRLPAVSDMVSLSRSSIYARVQAGTFPAPVKMGKASGWVESEIQAWIDAQIHATRRTTSSDFPLPCRR